MKRLYVIGGTMGVGKTTVGRVMQRKLDRCVFLDGDWCWDMHPFQVTEANKKMVLDNICFLLNGFLHCPDYDNIIFVWVLHKQGIIDTILARLDLCDCVTVPISLVCDADALEKRLQIDVDAGLREADVLERSVCRLPLYDALRTIQIDVSHLSPEQAAERILQYGEKDCL